LKRVSRLLIAHTSHAEHIVDHGHEISTFQHSAECITSLCTRTIHSRSWCNI